MMKNQNNRKLSSYQCMLDGFSPSLMNGFKGGDRYDA